MFKKGKDNLYGLYHMGNMKFGLCPVTVDDKTSVKSSHLHRRGCYCNKLRMQVHLKS